MDEQELLKERFKSAVSSAVKAISENFDLDIKFGDIQSQKKNSLNLPELSNLKKLQDFTNLRAFADSEALKIKYTNKKIFIENQPEGTLARALYSIAEKIRYEKIGSARLKGVKNNITQCYENKFKNKKIEEIKTEADVPITEAFELYLRSYFFKIKQNHATKKILSYWKDLFDKNLKKELKELDNFLEDQNKYNKLIADLINNLDFEDPNAKEKEKNDSSDQDKSSSEKNDENNDLSEQEENQRTDSDLNVVESSFKSLNQNEDFSEKEEKEVVGDPSLLKKNEKIFPKEKYKIFTNKYDE